MRRFAVLFATALFAVSAPAQQLLQCVDQHILNGIVFTASSEMKAEVTRDVPAWMSSIRTPAGFRLVGTSVRALGGRMTVVSFRTDQPNDKAHAALLSALAAEGWQVEASPWASPQTFRVAGAPMDGTVCRNGERRQVSTFSVDGVNYASITSFTESRRRECNAPDPAMDAMSMMGGQRSAAPRFQFPAGTSLAQGSGGGGGSSDMFTMSSRVISDATAAALVKHLEGQMVAQGWRPGSDWSGSGSAGSTWRKVVDDQPVWGTLEIVGVAENTYDVDFTMAR